MEHRGHLLLDFENGTISSGSLSPGLGRMGAPEARTGTSGMMLIVILRKVWKKRRGGEHDIWNVRCVLEATSLSISARFLGAR